MTRKLALNETHNTIVVVLCWFAAIGIVLHTFSRNLKINGANSITTDNNLRPTTTTTIVEETNNVNHHIVVDSQAIEDCDKTKVIIPLAFGNIISASTEATSSSTSGPVVQYGSVYGGFNLPGNNLCWLTNPGEEIIVYSFGVGEDISWDIALASLAPEKIKIHLFDPTPRAKQHFDAVIQVLETKTIPHPVVGGRKQEYIHPVTGEKSEISGTNIGASKWFAEVIKSNVRPADLTFHSYGLWNEDTQLEFFAPTSGVSHSFTYQRSGRSIKVEARKLSSLMKMLSHTKLDVLKFDIEGAEVRAVPDMVAYFKESGIWPKMILFDHDTVRLSGRPYKMNDALKTPDIVIKTLVDAGYRLFSYDNFDAVFLLDNDNN